MKKYVSLILVFVLLFSICGCTQKIKLIDDAPVKWVYVSNPMKEFEHMFTGDDAKAIVDYLLNVNLIEDKEADTDVEGSAYKIIVQYENGETAYLIQKANMFIKLLNVTPWYRIPVENCEDLDNLLKELTK